MMAMKDLYQRKYNKQGVVMYIGGLFNALQQLNSRLKVRFELHSMPQMGRGVAVLTNGLKVNINQNLCSEENTNWLHSNS